MSKHSHVDLIKGFSVERKAGSTVVVSGTVPFEELTAHEEHVLAHMAEHLDIKGFRKGHVPTSIARKHVGDMALLQETAEHVLAELYPDIVTTHALDVIGRPALNITKLAPGNPLEFTFTITVMPEITLPDYKALAAGINKERGQVATTEEDVKAAIERIQRSKLAYDRIQKKARTAQEAAANGVTLPTPETATEKADDEDYSKLPVPELTDEYVKTLGAFESVEHFTKDVRTHLEKEKADEAMSKHRGALTDALIAGASIEVPALLITSELAQIKGQMQEDLRRAGLTVEGYLEHIKKTMADLEREWMPVAEKRAKTQLVLNEIAKREQIEPNREDVVREMSSIMAHYKDADAERVRVYVESVLRNDAVMHFLESQA